MLKKGTYGQGRQVYEEVGTLKADIHATDKGSVFSYRLGWRGSLMMITVGIQFVLGTTPSHVSIPQIKVARWPKADK